MVAEPAAQAAAASMAELGKRCATFFSLVSLSQRAAPAFRREEVRAYVPWPIDRGPCALGLYVYLLCVHVYVCVCV